MQTLYTFHHYRPCLRYFLSDQAPRGTLTRAAQALGVQRSHLSRVIGEELHLTADQAYLMGEFFQWPEEDCLYFQLLVERDRGSHPKYIESRTRRLKELRESRELRSKASSRKSTVELPRPAHYFSTWMYGAVHVATMMDIKRSAQSISLRLNLGVKVVERILEELEREGLVESKKGEYFFKSGDVHLTKTSPFVVSHHMNWRMRAVENSQRLADDSLHYTLVQVIDKEHFEKIKDRLVSVIHEANLLASGAGKSKMMALNVDAFLIDGV